jgi:glucose-6-phosphate 1-epimerase
MIDIEKLNNTFGAEGNVKFSKKENDLIYLIVSNKYADAEICIYGAHIMSFRPHNSVEVLWMSSNSSFQVGKPIRGGIPVCFPWFGPHKNDPVKPQHGFGRLMNWELVETATKPGGETLVRLQLCSSEETKTYWPYDFCAELTVIVGQTLEVSLKVTNQSAEPIEYTCALHSYYNVSSIENITITGLQGAGYHSQLEPGEFIQDSPIIEIQKAETRHYHNTEAACVIEDSMFRRKIHIGKAGSKITTVWNPGKETCAMISDMPDVAYLHFVCIEAVNAFDDLIWLAPGKSHTTSAIIGLEA